MPSCVWVRVPSLALYQEIEECSFGLFFLCPRTEFGQTLRASRYRTPLSLRDISRGRTETSAAVSVARTFFRDRGVFPGLFFFARESGLEKRSGPRGFVPLCHCMTSPWGERKRLSPFRSLARFLEIEDCSPVSFFAPAGGVLESAPSKSYESADGGAAVGGSLRRARYRPRKNAKHKRQSGRFPCRDDATPSII